MSDRLNYPRHDPRQWETLVRPPLVEIQGSRTLVPYSATSLAFSATRDQWASPHQTTYSCFTKKDSRAGMRKNEDVALIESSRTTLFQLTDELFCFQGPPKSQRVIGGSFTTD